MTRDWGVKPTQPACGARSENRLHKPTNLDHSEFSIQQRKQGRSVMSSTEDGKSPWGVKNQERTSNVMDHNSLDREGALRWTRDMGMIQVGENQVGKHNTNKGTARMGKVHSWNREQVSWSKVGKVFMEHYRWLLIGFNSMNSFCRVSGRYEAFWTYTAMFRTKEVTQRIFLLSKDNMTGCISYVMNVMSLMSHIY